MMTPWGLADEVRVLAPGVIDVYTPSHGGIHVTGDALKRIPLYARSRSCAGPEWYEEDCDWAIVARFIPEAFSEEHRVAAADTLARWHPELLMICHICEKPVTEDKCLHLEAADGTRFMVCYNAGCWSTERTVCSNRLMDWVTEE